tara:strand:- start:236 stop:547 length:312 start_codon:yes stop_codon:yes gene_type:complete
MGVSMLQIDLLGSAISGALVVLFGAGYALLFAFSQLKKSKGMLVSSFASYLCLVIAINYLLNALQMSGWGIGLIWFVILGYFLGPIFIWYLTLQTHNEDLNNE